MSAFALHGSGDAVSRRIDYAKELNREQLDVVLHGDGPCLVLAGAGSGKTRTLTYRVAYLLENGADPSSILLLTFTNKAAREMLHRVSALLGAEAARIWGGTFHSVGSRILRAFAEHIGYTSNFSILDAEDACDLVKAVMKDLQIDPKARRFPSPSVVQDVLSYARNTQSPIGEALDTRYPGFSGCLADFEEIARQYQTRKKTANVMDFDDLLSNLAAILEDPTLGASVSDRFRYVLVDEFQDTNALQARIVKGFARVHRNICVVGDDAQSIYAFRGADVRNILSFPDAWPNAKIFKLVTNYRSTPQILDLANASLSHNREQFEKDLLAVCDHGEKPKLVLCASAAEEARYVADRISTLRDEGADLRDVAVLFRSSSHSQALEFELIKRDIPYEYRGGQKFFERAHIKDVVAFLRISQNPKDEVAWLRALGLQQGIGATTASNVASRIRAADSFDQALERAEASGFSARARAGWSDFLAIAQEIMAGGDEPARAIRAAAHSCYRDYLEREFPNWRERLEDLEQLASFAETYGETEPFLADIALYDDVVSKRRTSEEGSRVALSTIHQAKGLEWDSVFVVHLADGLFPSRRALGEDGGMEEERRLFYVAVTRSRRRLFLAYPMTAGYDAFAFNQPSAFIEEVPPRLFDRVEIRGAGANHAKYRMRNSDADDGSWDEPAIELDANGERRAAKPSRSIVWKKR